MDKNETYLWGTLLALVREQLAALEKHSRGKLGMWGKARIGARNKEMQKFLFKLLEHKAKVYGDSAIEGLISDLEAIEKDQNVWRDIASEEIDYLRTILSSLE